MPKSLIGRLVTALPLDEKRLTQITHQFQELLQQPVILEMNVDQSLIGGIRVELLGRVYDGSVKAQLGQALAVLKDEEASPHA